VVATWWLVRALTIQVRYYDSYDYLNDARALLGDHAASFFGVHSPLIPILGIPSALAWDPENPSRWAWMVPHLTGFLLAVAALWACHQFLARFLRPRWALLGTAVIGLSPVVAHYAPHLLTDIPAMGLTAYALARYDRHVVEGGATSALGLGAVVGLAVAAKYSLAVLPVALGTAGAIRLVSSARPRPGRRPWVRLLRDDLLAALAAALTFGGLLVLRYQLTTETGFTRADFAEDLRVAQEMVEPLGDEHPVDFLYLLARSLGPAVLVLAPLGAVALVRKVGWARALGPLLLAVGFVVSMGLKVGMTQARYLLPTFPVLVLAALVPAAHLARRFPRTSLALATAIALPVLGLGLAQGARDADAFYWRPIQRRVAERIRTHVSPEGRVYWANHFVSMTPPEPVVFPRDEYFSFFHLGHPGIGFLTRRAVVGSHERRARTRVASEDALLVVGARRFHHAGNLQAGTPLPCFFSLVYREGGEVREERLPTGSCPTAAP